MKSNILHLIKAIINDPQNLKKAIIILVVIIVGVIGSISFFGNEKEDASNLLDVENSSENKSDEEGTPISDAEGGLDPDGPLSITSAAVIYIDVAGAVTNPGVITISPESRVFEAIEAAGGLTKDANTNSINRAAMLIDGEKIYIPTNEEVKNASASDDSFGNSESVSSGGTSNSSSGSSNSSAGNSTNSSGKININSADSITLQQLNGVGPSTAQKIIDYRSSNGKFKKIEDIKNISGIGEKTFEKLKNHITV